MIHIPEHIWIDINKVNRIESELASLLHRTPVMEEILEKTNLTPERVKQVKEARFTGTVYRIQPKAVTPIYDMETNDENNDIMCVDAITKKSCDSVEELVLNRLSNQYLVKCILSSLTKRQQYVLIHRFGLFESEIKTFRELGNDLNVNTSRARQIYELSLKKIREMMIRGNMNDSGDSVKKLEFSSNPTQEKSKKMVYKVRSF